MTKSTVASRSAVSVNDDIPTLKLPRPDRRDDALERRLAIIRRQPKRLARPRSSDRRRSRRSGLGILEFVWRIGDIDADHQSARRPDVRGHRRCDRRHRARRQRGRRRFAISPPPPAAHPRPRPLPRHCHTPNVPIAASRHAGAATIRAPRRLPGRLRASAARAPVGAPAHSAPAARRRPTRRPSDTASPASSPCPWR